MLLCVVKDQDLCLMFKRSCSPDIQSGNCIGLIRRRLLICVFLCLSLVFHSQTDEIVLFLLLHFYTPFLFILYEYKIFIHMLFEKESNVSNKETHKIYVFLEFVGS